MRLIAAGRVLGLLSKQRSRKAFIAVGMCASAATRDCTLRSSSSVMRSNTLCDVSHVDAGQILYTCHMSHMRHMSPTGLKLREAAACASAAAAKLLGLEVCMPLAFACDV